MLVIQFCFLTLNHSQNNLRFENSFPNGFDDANDGWLGSYLVRVFPWVRQTTSCIMTKNEHYSFHSFKDFQSEPTIPMDSLCVFIWFLKFLCDFANSSSVFWLVLQKKSAVFVWSCRQSHRFFLSFWILQTFHMLFSRFFYQIMKWSARYFAEVL